MNELLGPASRFSRGVAVMFGLEEQEGVPTVAPEIVPVSELHATPEQWHLMGGASAFAGTTVAAGGAGTNSQLAVVPGEGEVCIIDGVILDISSTTQLVLAWRLADLSGAWASTAGVIARDIRHSRGSGGVPVTGTVLWQTNSEAAAFAAVIARIRLANSTAVFGPYVPLGIVVVRPWKVIMATVAQNEALAQHTLCIRTRAATPRELAIGAI